MWVLIIYAWTMTTHAGNGIAATEFTTKEKCESAAQSAATKFDGVYSKTYWVCVPK